MKLYVYCLAEGVAAITESIRGVSRAPVRLVRFEQFVVLASNLEDDTVPVNRENVLAHAAVVRSVLDQTTPLPFRFGTLITEEELSSYIASRKTALEEKLAHVRDCVEMSVKIIWKVAKEQAERPVAGQGTGTAFLAEKRRELLGDESRAAEAREIAGRLHQSVRGLTRDEQVSLRPNEALMLAAAHLVERTNLRGYEERVAAARESHPELHFLVSGPWPPYSFANGSDAVLI